MNIFEYYCSQALCLFNSLTIIWWNFIFPILTFPKLIRTDSFFDHRKFLVWVLGFTSREAEIEEYSFRRLFGELVNWGVCNYIPVSCWNSRALKTLLKLLNFCSWFRLLRFFLGSFLFPPFKIYFIKISWGNLGLDFTEMLIRYEPLCNSNIRIRYHFIAPALFMSYHIIQFRWWIPIFFFFCTFLLYRSRELSNFSVSKEFF